MIPLVRASFYVTETEATRGALVFLRKPTWCAPVHPAVRVQLVKSPG